jgi:hypothetical protein
MPTNEILLQNTQQDIDAYRETTLGGQKAASLQPSINNKLNIIENKRLQYQPDTLLGLSDADSFRTANLGQARATTTTGQFFDALELPHGNQPLFGVGTDFAKSPRAIERQRQSAAQILNIPVNQVTNQDIIDIGNQQQIQLLADAIDPNSGFEAPLIRGLEEPTNLTGRGFTDEFGNRVPDIPLNIPIETAQTGRTSPERGSRILATFRAAGDNTNIIDRAAIDPRRNVFANELKNPSNRQRPTGPITFSPANESRISEDIDLLQSQGLKLWADASNAARKASRAIVSAVGINPDDIGLYDSDRARLLGTEATINEIRENTELRDELSGFNSRKEWDVERQKLLTAVENDEYGEAAWSVLTNLDRYLAESAPETGVILVPWAGIPSLVGTRLSNQMEQFEENNGREMNGTEAATAAAGILATLYGERFLIQSGAGQALEGFVNSVNRGRRILGVAGSAAGEGLQEAAENIQETAATQRVGERSLGEIATSAETIASAIAGAVVGGGLRGGAEIASASIPATASAISRVEDVVNRVADRAEELTPRTEEVPTQTRDAEGNTREVTTEAVPRGDSRRLAQAFNLRRQVNELDSLEQRVNAIEDPARRERLLSSINEQREKIASRVNEYEAEFREIDQRDAPDNAESVFGSKEQALVSLLETAENTQQEQDVINSIQPTEQQLEVARESVRTLNSLDDVESEIVEGARGYRTYFNDLIDARANGNRAAERSARTNLQLFAERQKRKADIINNKVRQIQRTIRSEGRIDSLANTSFRDSPKDTVDWGTGSLEINWSDVAKSLRNDEPVGAVRVGEAALNSYNEMRRLTALASGRIPQRTTSRQTRNITSESTSVSQTVDRPTPAVSADESRDPVAEPTVEEVKNIIRENVTRSTEPTEQERQIIANASDSGLLQRANRELAAEIREEARAVEEQTSPEVELSRDAQITSDAIDSLEEELRSLSSERAGVKRSIRAHYTELKRLKDKKNRLIERINERRSEERVLELAPSTLADMLDRLNIIIQNMLYNLKKIKDLINKHYGRINQYNETLDRIEESIGDVRKSLSSLRAYRRSLEARMKEETTQEVQETVDSSYNYSQANLKLSELYDVNNVAAFDINSLRVPVRADFNKRAERVKELLPNILSEYGRVYGGVWQTVFPKESPLRLLVNQNGVFDDHTINAITLQMLDTVSNSLLDTKFNDDIAIRKLLGVSEDAVIPSDIRNRLQGIGSLYKLEAASAGRGLIKKLGLKQKDSANYNTQLRLESDLGSTVLRLAQELGLVTYDNSLKASEYVAMKDRILIDDSNPGVQADASITASADEATVPFIRATDRVTFDYVNDISKTVDIIADQSGIETSKKLPRFSRRTGQTFRVRGMSRETVIPDKQIEVLKQLSNTPWRLDSKRINSVEKLYKSAPKTVLRMFGYIDPKSVHVSLRDGVEGKNAAIQRSLDNIIGFKNRTGTREFYFDYFFSKNGRFFIDSPVINPQTDKIHRFLMREANSSTTIDTEAKRDNFKLAVVQAFDGASLERTVLPNGEEIAELGSIDKQSKSDSLNQFEALMVTHEKAINDVKAGNFNTINVVRALQGTDHPVHALMALEEMSKYSNEAVFDTDMVVETDAITSGFILGLMSNPTLPYDRLKEWLAKGGVWLGGTDAESYGEWRGMDSNKDSYETSAEIVREFVDANESPSANALRDWVKVDRKFMKAPFMTFIYGEGIESIAKSLGDSYGIKLVEELSNKKTVEEALRRVNALNSSLIPVSFVNRFNNKTDAEKEIIATNAANYFRERPIEDPIVSRAVSAVSSAVESVYGGAIAETLEQEFGPTISARRNMNNAFTLMFNKFKEEFDSRFNDSDKTTASRNKILDEMVKDGKVPGMLTVYSDSASQRVPVMSTNTVSADSSNIVISKFKENSRKRQRKVHPLIREYIASPSAGAVVGIHWLDGSIMANTLDNHSGLGVHDAVVSNIGNSVNTAIRYNRSSWRLTSTYSPLQASLAALEQTVGRPKSFKPNKGDLVYFTQVSRTSGNEFVVTAEALGNNRFKLNSDKIITRTEPVYETNDDAQALIVFKGLEEAIETVNENKRQMALDGADIEHMAIPGSKYKAKPVIPTTAAEIETRLGKLDTKAKDDIMSIFKRFKDCINGL